MKKLGPVWPEPQNPEYGWRGFSMPKYTKEFKIKLVMEYLSGKSVGRMMVAKKYDIPEGGYITKLDSKI